MTPERELAWARGIVQRVPRLWDSIRRGNVGSLFILGEREVGGRRVQLTLEAKVIEGAPIRGDGWEVLPIINPPREDEPAAVRARNVVNPSGRSTR